jgi:hypothetical protein
MRALTTAKGEVFAGDHHAGIAEIGKPRRKMIGAPPGFLPNGVAMLPTREFLIANLGPGGSVWRLDRDGGYSRIFSRPIASCCGYAISSGSTRRAANGSACRPAPIPANARSARTMPMALSCATIELARTSSPMTSASATNVASIRPAPGCT